MLLFTAVVLQSCRERVILSNQTLEMSAFSDLKRNEYALNSRILRNHLRNIIHADKDSAFTDFRVRDYYLRDGKWMWIDRKGVDYRADLLLQCLDTIDRIGFSREKFCVNQMKNDLRRVRELAFDDSTGTNDVNEVVARLEYNLTKNYLRYVCGQRYGFVDPYYVFNRLDIAEGKPAQKGDTASGYDGLEASFLLWCVIIILIKSLEKTVTTKTGPPTYAYLINLCCRPSIWLDLL